MELLQLRYFLAVAESEHMTNTAKQLHIAQPALTQSIHRLEQELGVSLFERAGRGIRLSPAGAYVRDRVKPAMETLENVVRDVQLFQQGEQGVVRVGVHAASGVAIDGIAVPAGSALGETASLSDFASERFIALAGSRRFREVCDTFCARRAFTPHIAFESDNPLVVKKMIGLGLGVGFWPDHSWGDLDPKSCRLVHLQETEFMRDVVVAKTSRCTPDSEAQRFYEFLLDYVAKRWEE